MHGTTTRQAVTANASLATVTRLDRPLGPSGIYVYAGYIEGEPDQHQHLWTAAGSWREDGKAHPFDLVNFLTTEDEEI